jgi:hypothetical protein
MSKKFKKSAHFPILFFVSFRFLSGVVNAQRTKPYATCASCSVGKEGITYVVYEMALPNSRNLVMAL